MVAFKLFLSLALVAVALAADVAQIPRATVTLVGPSSATIGQPFYLRCNFNTTLPKEDMPSTTDLWVADVSFFRGVGSLNEEQVFGTYKVNSGLRMEYHTENLYEGINVYPATDTSKDNGQEMRKEFFVVVLITEPQMTMSNGYQCAVKLHQNYKNAIVKYNSNKVQVNTV